MEEMTPEWKQLLASTLLLYAASERFADMNRRDDKSTFDSVTSTLFDASTSFVISYLEVLKTDKPELENTDQRIEFLRTQIERQEHRKDKVLEFIGKRKINELLHAVRENEPWDK